MLKSLNITKDQLSLLIKYIYPDMQDILIIEEKYKNFELVEEEIKGNWYINVVLQTNEGGENDR